MIFPDFHGNILGERKITEKDLKKKSNNIFPSEILECEKKEFKFHQIKVSEAQKRGKTNFVNGLKENQNDNFSLFPMLVSPFPMKKSGKLIFSNFRSWLTENQRNSKELNRFQVTSVSRQKIDVYFFFSKFWKPPEKGPFFAFKYHISKHYLHKKYIKFGLETITSLSISINIFILL